MKKICLLTGAVMVMTALWGMTAFAAESEVHEEVVVVDYDFEESYIPHVFYTLEGAERFRSADRKTRIDSLEAGIPVKCYQKTTNGYYYATMDGSNTFYIYEDAVSGDRESKRKAVQIAEEPAKQEGILFIYSGFGEMEQTELINPATGKRIILRGMGMYDYETYDFISLEDEKIQLIKTYKDGSVIEQEFTVQEAKKQVGIYDDGSVGKSWIEIDGEFIYEE